MSLCKPVTGDLVRLSLAPNPSCLLTPQINRVITTAIAQDATTASLGLDPAFGSYSASTIRNLYSGTVLYFGAAQTPIKIVKDYVLTTTAQTVEIAPAPLAVAANALADSYLAGQLCLNSKTLNTNPQTANAYEDCDGDGLLKSVIVGNTRDLQISGQLQSSASLWALLERLGNKNSNAFFYLTYSDLFGEYGKLQLSAPNKTNAAVGSLTDFTSTAQILEWNQHYPVSSVGLADPSSTTNGVILTAAGLGVQQAVRRLWGLPPLTAQ